VTGYFLVLGFSRMNDRTKGPIRSNACANSGAVRGSVATTVGGRSSTCFYRRFIFVADGPEKKHGRHQHQSRPAVAEMFLFALANGNIPRELKIRECALSLWP
jgi:hypothetical protein